MDDRDLQTAEQHSTALKTDGLVVNGITSQKESTGFKSGDFLGGVCMGFLWVLQFLLTVQGHAARLTGDSRSEVSNSS